MLNKIFLQGRLVADSELRHTQQNIPVASFRLAVDRDFKDKATGKAPTDFINIVAWRGVAEFASKYFSKGRMAVVEGRLQVRDYSDQNGNRRYMTEVVASNIYFGDSRRDNQASGNVPAAPSSYASPANFGAPGSGFAELGDDDGELPF